VSETVTIPFSIIRYFIWISRIKSPLASFQSALLALTDSVWKVHSLRLSSSLPTSYFVKSLFFAHHDRRFLHIMNYLSFRQYATARLDFNLHTLAWILLNAHFLSWLNSIKQSTLVLLATVSSLRKATEPLLCFPSMTMLRSVIFLSPRLIFWTFCFLSIESATAS
jgi:hypothetical protein